MMKLITPLLLLALLASCLGYKELPVEYDYSYKGNFKKYRTFDIMKPAGLNDTTMVNDLIERSIIARMKFLGYRQASNKPHLIIGFKMFADSLKFNGYNQPEIEEWVLPRREAQASQGYGRAPLASPTHYVDVPFPATANTPYRIWLRLKALTDDEPKAATRDRCGPRPR